ncbi:hypothetical protein RND71_025154 [Anisodus tanguticus]|uniref:Uncharacterized protein n=1 Tax=Anisodus tanguticus TaxID=243964 RepID=A0AAE1V4K6_9SOLA|nr:hypothetical protein RND71_025154 [Anisodus tanguticus]
MESNVYFHIQDEVERLLKEVGLMMKNADNSELYAGMRLDLEWNETFQQHLSRLLGSHSHVQVVIYALGSMEYRFQGGAAALMLHLKNMTHWTTGVATPSCSVAAPWWSVAKLMHFLKLKGYCLSGATTLMISAATPPPMEDDTMVVPHSIQEIHENDIPESSQGDGLSNTQRPSNNQNATNTETNSATAERILPFIIEIDIKTRHEEIYTNVFSRFAWHFFDVGPNMNMETSLPGTGFPSNLDSSWRIYLPTKFEFTSENLMNTALLRRANNVDSRNKVLHLYFVTQVKSSDDLHVHVSPFFN